MIKHKSYVEMEEHCTKIKIKGWESYKNFKYENAKVIYSGMVDGRKFHVETKGSELIGNVIDRICKAVQ